jgi:pilus assembly protein CpaB
MSTSPRTRATQLGAVGFAAVALLCAGFAAYLVKSMISARGYTGDRVRPVVVAKHALPAARPIAPDDVDIMAWPEKHVPEGVVSDPKELFGEGKPLIPTTGILEGEPIVPSRLANQAQGTALAALVRDGYRAIAVKVDDAVGRSALVYPGAHVDVVATVNVENHGWISRLAVQDARVLAVENETDVATRRPKRTEEAQNDISKNSFYGTVVTLEVTPGQAEIVSLAARIGHVDLGLRNGTDANAVTTFGAYVVQLSPFEDESTTPGSGAYPSPPSAEKDKKGGRGKRGIELRAVDSRNERRENGEPKPEIENYHAR